MGQVGTEGSSASVSFRDFLNWGCFGPGLLCFLPPPASPPPKSCRIVIHSRLLCNDNFARHDGYMAISLPTNQNSIAPQVPTTLPIATLEPTVVPSSQAYLDAVVTLVWPYSSSSRSTSLLLAEPDFRLRRHRGQVRVCFTGPAARAVGSSGIGIGDRVLLALVGCTWDSSDSLTFTPGRSVDGELNFRHRLKLLVMFSTELWFSF